MVTTLIHRFWAIIRPAARQSGWWHPRPLGRYWKTIEIWIPFSFLQTELTGRESRGGRFPDLVIRQWCIAGIGCQTMTGS